jgi:hypothetical protein
MGIRKEKILPRGRVEEAYLLVDTSSKNVETVPNQAAGMTLPCFGGF